MTSDEEKMTTLHSTNSGCATSVVDFSSPGFKLGGPSRITYSFREAEPLFLRPVEPGFVVARMAAFYEVPVGPCVGTQ